MLHIGKIFDTFFKNTSQKELDKLKSIIKKINDWEEKIKKIPDESFPAKTSEFKEKIKSGIKLENLIPEAFAYVREAARRTLGERHFDVQLMGGIILHQGKIAEMKTGEGKTLVSTLPVYLNSLIGEGVHVVTVNDYLARRDSEWMGKIYNFLGMSVGCITNEMDDAARKKNYNCDVTYGTNNEFGFDYLRDNMKYDADQMVQRNHFFCIVDEVDSILIDEARTPLVISGGTENHCILIDLRSKNITGKEAEEALDLAGITVNKNTVPFETRSPFITSGIRIGTAALTTRGMKENDMRFIGGFIVDILNNIQDSPHIEQIRLKVRDFSEQFPLSHEQHV